jgi:RNA polymerase sigma-70 factor (ECF subfamily)
MATRSTALQIEETQLCGTLNQPQPLCPEVLRAVYNMHYRHVLQVCRRFFRQPEDAEDAAAEVFLKLYRVLHQKDQTCPFRPWISQVAGHHCIDKIRQRNREKSSSLESLNLTELCDPVTPSPLSEVLRHDEERRLREQLGRLPEKYKVALVLRYYRQMSYAEIASALNTRLPTVRIMIFRAKNYLRRNLRRAERPKWRVMKSRGIPLPG